MAKVISRLLGYQLALASRPLGLSGSLDSENVLEALIPALARAARISAPPHIGRDERAA